MNYTIKDLMTRLYKSLWLIILCVVLVCGPTLGIALATNEHYYTSNTKIYVKLVTPSGSVINPSAATLEYVNQKINDSFILLQGQTYCQLVADKVNDGDINIKIDYQAVQKSISFRKLGDKTTSVISLSAKATDPIHAQYLADCAANVVNDYLTFTESLLNFQVYETATLPTKYDNSVNVPLTVLIAFLLTIFLISMIIVIVDISKDIVVSPSRISDNTQPNALEVLSIIPSVKKNGGKL
ncbi:MAG: hypothetical protein RR416_01505 [Clostridia bacterium]